jgi:hypothetical protein
VDMRGLWLFTAAHTPHRGVARPVQGFDSKPLTLDLEP